MFLDGFPSTFFQLSKTESVVATDFLRAIKLDSRLKEDSSMYTIYQCADNETPEIISHKYYGNTGYHWIIMLLNERFDPFIDFPKTDYIIRKYTVKKWGSLDGVHHYVDSTGDVVDAFAIDKTPVTHYEFELDRNEKLRPVKVLRKELLGEFIGMYRSMIAV